MYLYLSGYLRSKASRSSLSTQGCWSHGPSHDICSPADISSSKEMNYKGFMLSFHVDIFTIVAVKAVWFHNVLQPTYIQQVCGIREEECVACK